MAELDRQSHRFHYASPASGGPVRFSRLALIGLAWTVLTPGVVLLAISPTGPIDWIDDCVSRPMTLALAAILIVGTPVVGAVLSGLGLVDVLQRKRRGIVVAAVGTALGMISTGGACVLMWMLAHH